MKIKLICFTAALFSIFFLLFCFTSIASSCSVSISGITQQPSEESWPYWAEGNVTSSISFNAPENVRLYHFTSALSTWSESASPQWVYVGGCSPLDFGDFSGNLPENPFEWYIGYLNDGKYKLELVFYCEYLENTTRHNCTAEAETIFTISKTSESNTSGSVTADFTYTPDQPTIFDSVQFQSTSQVTNGYITQYQWSLDGAIVSTGYETWEYSFPTEGIHTVELAVTDSNQNSDSISFSFEVNAAEWFIIDAATGRNVQQTAPWELQDQTTTFQYGENIVAWGKIGNITQAMSIDFVWNTPDFTTMRSISKSIDDPHSYGYSMWESYAVWDNISMGMPLYETIFSNPGSYSVTVYVEDNPERVLDFTIASARDFSAKLDKTKVITGEQIIISGSVKENTMPVDDTLVSIQIYRKNQLMTTYTDVNLDEQGRFNQSYTIPVVDTSSGSIEDWSVQLSADSTDITVAQMTEMLSFQVLPVYLELMDVKLVQIIETPDFTDWGGSYPYFALNRPAAVRVMLRFPSWTKDFSTPQVTVSFSRNPFVAGPTIIEEYTAKVNDEVTNIDIPFTLSKEGSYLLEIDVDPYHQFSNPLTMQSYIQTLHWEDEVISKQMKSLMLRFIPVDIPSVLDDPSQLAFIKKQMDFIRDVYPIPKEEITFRCCQRYDTQIYEQSKWTLVNMLATKNLLGNYGNNRVILVGVTPQSWWDPGDQGMALGKYVTSAVIIKNNSEDVSVTGHEIGHTLGLRIWTEEYDLSNYYTQRHLSGLILKDENIVNLSVKDEYVNAFPNLINLGRRVQAVTFYCMMGNAHYSWICEQDYIDLFRALKDPPNDQCVLVNGWINPDENISVGNCYLLTESTADIPFQQGEFTIEVVSSTEEVLYTDTFGKTTDETNPFSFIIPWFDDASAIHIKKETTILSSIAPSDHQPSITLNQPKGGETVDDVLTVSWQGSDADGDTLSYTVFYSHDQIHWDIINTEPNQTTVEIDTRYLPGGSTCKIRMIATDGFYVDMVESASFTIQKKQPVCTIIDGEQILGIAYDLEDGELPDSKMQWYSDIQGYLGDGDHVSMDVLQTGSHLITMKATDSDGNMVETSLKKSIDQQQQNSTNGIVHVFCLEIDENGSPIGQKTVFSADETMYSLISFEEITLGDQLSWVFSGPNQQNKTASLLFESSGNMYGFAPIDISTVNKTGAVGQWQVDIFLNDALVLSDSFTVAESADTPVGIEVLFFTGAIMVLWLKRKRK